MRFFFQYFLSAKYLKKAKLWMEILWLGCLCSIFIQTKEKKRCKKFEESFNYHGIASVFVIFSKKESAEEFTNKPEL